MAEAKAWVIVHQHTGDTFIYAFRTREKMMHYVGDIVGGYLDVIDDVEAIREVDELLNAGDFKGAYDRWYAWKEDRHKYQHDEIIHGDVRIQ